MTVSFHSLRLRSLASLGPLMVTHLFMHGPGFRVKPPDWRAGGNRKRKLEAESHLPTYLVAKVGEGVLSSLIGMR